MHSIRYLYCILALVCVYNLLTLLKKTFLSDPKNTTSQIWPMGYNLLTLALGSWKIIKQDEKLKCLVNLVTFKKEFLFIESHHKGNGDRNHKLRKICTTPNNKLTKAKCLEHIKTSNVSVTEEKMRSIIKLKWLARI